MTPHVPETEPLSEDDQSSVAEGSAGPDALAIIGRIVGWLGLTIIAGFHLLWGMRTPWPFATKEDLGEAMVGSREAIPDTRMTLTVAGGAGVAAAIVAGLFGRGRIVRAIIRLMAWAMMVRQLLPGEKLVRWAGLSEPSPVLRRYDALIYRPFDLVLGIALFLSLRNPGGRHRKNRS